MNIVLVNFDEKNSYPTPYSPIVECIYFHEARNAEIAPTRANIGIIPHTYVRNNWEKSDKNGIKSTKSDWDRINTMSQTNVTIAKHEAIIA